MRCEICLKKEKLKKYTVFYKDYVSDKKLCDECSASCVQK